MIRLAAALAGLAGLAAYAVVVYRRFRADAAHVGVWTPAPDSTVARDSLHPAHRAALEGSDDE